MENIMKQDTKLVTIEQQVNAMHEVEAQKGVLTAKGRELAKNMFTADSLASASKRTYLLDLAGEYLSKERASIVLDSYQSALVEFGCNPNSAKVRKSEANTVLKACSLTEATNDNWVNLSEFKGEYNDWIGYARELVQSASNKPKIERVSRHDEALTEKQEELVHNSIAKSNVVQLREIVESASNTLNSKTNPTIAGLQQLILISVLATNLNNNEQIEQSVRDTANKVWAIVDAQIKAIEKAQATAKETIESVQNNIPFDVAVNE
jgi:hypothetical protein